MKIVEFVRDNLPYRKGETASFEDAVADRMVRGGAGRHVVPLAQTLALETDVPPAQTAAIQAGYKRKG